MTQITVAWFTFNRSWSIARTHLNCVEWIFDIDTTWQSRPTRYLKSKPHATLNNWIPSPIDLYSLCSPPKQKTTTIHVNGDDAAALCAKCGFTCQMRLCRPTWHIPNLINSNVRDGRARAINMWKHNFETTATRSIDVNNLIKCEKGFCLCTIYELALQCTVVSHNKCVRRCKQNTRRAPFITPDNI